MSHRPFRKISATVGLTAEHRDIPMSRIALYPFEELLDRQPRPFQCLRKIAGIKEQSAGDVLLFIFSPRCLENLGYLCISFCIFAFNEVLTAVEDFVDVTVHGCSDLSRSVRHVECGALDKQGPEDYSGPPPETCHQKFPQRRRLGWKLQQCGPSAACMQHPVRAVKDEDALTSPFRGDGRWQGERIRCCHNAFHYQYTRDEGSYRSVFGPYASVVLWQLHRHIEERTVGIVGNERKRATLPEKELSDSSTN
jgi:hypothetical protein